MKWYQAGGQQTQLWLLALCASLGLALPFVRYDLGAAALVGLFPLLVLIEFIQKRLSFRGQLLVVMLSAYVGMLMASIWILQTAPEKWAYIDGWQAQVTLLLTFLGFAALLSLTTLVFMLLLSYFRVKLYEPRAFLLLPAFWIVGEVTRSMVFSIVVYGHNASIGPYWNFATLGIAAGTTPVGYIARLGGMYGLSFISVACGLAVLWAVRKHRYRPLLGGVICIFVLATVSWYAYRPSTATVTVGVVQYPAMYTSEPRPTTLSVSERDGAADIVVLPEYAGLASSDDQIGAASNLFELANDRGVVVTSRLSRQGVATYNQLEVYDRDGAVVASEAKQFLIPVTEYTPYGYRLLSSALDQTGALALIDEDYGVTKGPTAPTAHAVGSVTLGPQACSGAIAPDTYRGQVAGGAQVLTNSANLSMFSSAPQFAEQAQQFTHFIAIANARPYAQASMGGESYILDSDGELAVFTNLNDTTYRQAAVQLQPQTTPYSLFGEWVVGFSLGVVLFLGIDKRKRTRRNSNGTRQKAPKTNK